MKARAERGPAPYINPYLAGTFLGVLLFVSFLVTGHGLGASGGLARMIVWVQDLFVSSHVDANPALATMAGGDANPLDHWLVWAIIGAMAGGFVSGWMGRRLRIETFRGPNISVRARWIAALLGGTLVGFGARMARGCTSGQALSGGAVLSLGSWAFMFSVFAGGYLLAYFVRRLWN
ncbi:MAG: YeeE/YedE thiosulfate transporter family protein [Myxococcota bacterium]|jgi:uncharacterized membrane protein YedE/YeeE|nr:YeeE/YedE thiosulfate transporter family protein [Myxococcota bacterium]